MNVYQWSSKKSVFNAALKVPSGIFLFEEYDELQEMKCYFVSILRKHDAHGVLIALCVHLPRLVKAILNRIALYLLA